MARLRSALIVRSMLAIVAATAFLLGLYVFDWSKKGDSSGTDGQPIARRELPNVQFYDGDNKSYALSEFRGKVILLNIWATWCAPCRKEMPALDRLQQKLGGRDFEVVALSIDRGGAAEVRRFYKEIGIGALGVYVDPTSAVTSTLRSFGVPTTLLIDRQGREVWRKTGPAEWDGERLVESLRLCLTTPASCSHEAPPSAP